MLSVHKTGIVWLALVAATGSVAVRAASGQREGARMTSLWTARVPRVTGAKDHFVAPDGRATNAGTKEAPWDLASTVEGRQKVAPGDIVWVRGGAYTGKIEVRLVGKEGAPIHVRAYPGERATIRDTTPTVVSPAAHVWLWDLEITTTYPREKRQIQEPGSHPGVLEGFGDGLGIHGGEGCKYINLVIHDTRQGISFWVGATNSEIHGCLIYDNGWLAPDRGHGHCIYTQNKDGVKTISNCIMSALYKGAYTMHAYGSERAYVDNYLVEDNIAYQEGPFLIGGGRPSHNVKVFRNYLYGVPMRLGYGAENVDCEVRDNVIAGGALRIDRFQKIVNEGNLLELPASRAVLIPNKYDPNRAHLAIYNGARAPSVAVDVAPFFKPGDRFRLMNPRDFFGKPVLEGRCDGPRIMVPTAGEFAALVVVKEEG